jgi:hypothetical protein
MKKKIVFVLTLVLLVCAASFAGCSKPEPPAEEEPLVQDEESKAVQQTMEDNEIPVADNPLIGEYITTGGVHITLTDAGEYRWLEPNGMLVKGVYTISKGTSNGTEYVYESETGPLYTLMIELQTEGDFEEGQIVPNTPFSMLVFDYYHDNVWRVTMLDRPNLWFEATKQ